MAERKLPLVRDEAVGTYLSAGCCSHFIEAYVERFPKEQLHISFYDDLKADPQGYMRCLFAFLRVRRDFTPDLSHRRNVSGGEVRDPVLRALWTGSAAARLALRPYVAKGLRDWAFNRVTRNLVATPMPADTRRKLVNIYRDEVLRLQSLTGRDLTHWLDSQT